MLAYPQMRIVLLKFFNILKNMPRGSAFITVAMPHAGMKRVYMDDTRDGVNRSL